MNKRIPILIAVLCAFVAPAFAQDKPTYAERLGFPKGARVVLFHNDDAVAGAKRRLDQSAGIRTDYIRQHDDAVPVGVAFRELVERKSKRR